MSVSCAGLARFPVGYVIHLADVVATLGGSSGEILRLAGVDDVQSRDPRARVGLVQYASALKRAYAMVGERGLAVWYGKHMHWTWHGHLGSAVIASRSLREAINLAAKYAVTRLPGMRVNLKERPSGAKVIFACHTGDPLLDLHHLYSTVAFATYAMHRAFSLETPVRITLAHERPAWFDEKLLSGKATVVFGHKENAMHFPSRILDSSSRTMDEESLFIAMENCEEELARAPEEDFLSVVAREITRHRNRIPSQGEVSKTLGMSAAAMTRRLTQEGTTFRDLGNRARLALAVELLVSGREPIEHIADALGYSDAANFARAFKKQAGVSPREYRRVHAGRQAVSG